jgi:hypothetical protein
VSRNVFRRCKASLEAVGSSKHFYEVGKVKLQVDVGFLCDEAPMMVAMLRDTVKWTLYIFMSNTQQGKIISDCSDISMYKLLLSFVLPLLLACFLSFLFLSFFLSPPPHIPNMKGD